MIYACSASTHNMGKIWTFYWLRSSYSYLILSLKPIITSRRLDIVVIPIIIITKNYFHAVMVYVVHYSEEKWAISISYIIKNRRDEHKSQQKKIEPMHNNMTFSHIQLTMVIIFSLNSFFRLEAVKVNESSSSSLLSDSSLSFSIRPSGLKY